MGCNNTDRNDAYPSVDPHVKAVVRTAEHEIRDLLRQRTDVVKRIGSIKRTLVGLADLFGNSILNLELLGLVGRSTPRQTGLTDACRTVLMKSAVPLSARQVRDQIKEGFPCLLDRHKDPLASVTTVLGRLVQYSQAKCIVGNSGRGRVWEWTGERSDALRPEL
jgi:hypothetical protein